MLNMKCVAWAVTPMVVLGVAITAFADPKTWLEQGPAPTLNGQTEGLVNNPVAGAINAIAASPSDPDLVYVGAVNGGIWKTTTATAANPTWIPLTDLRLPALSINSLAISPVHPDTIFAGTGSTSSLASFGSPGFGVARSTNGGKNWRLLASSTFAGQAINSIVPTRLANGHVVLAATLASTGGVFRSTENGASFARLSGVAGTGLPSGGVSSLVSDPTNPRRFYAGVPNFFGGGSNAGVYRSDDGGLTWASVSGGLAGLNGSLRILLSVHTSSGGNPVYAAIIDTNRKLSGVFRSTNRGLSWTPMGVPSPEIFPGSGGNIFGAIVADPTHPNVVFIAGDHQDLRNVPNVNGCTNFTSNTFRGDASLLPGNPWTTVDCNGAKGTSPHADARAMVFDTQGNLLQANDGGIYRLIDPNNTAGLRQWVSAIGNIAPTEFHSVAYDPLSKIVFGGTQDTGTTIQSAPGSLSWTDLLQGDGGNVAVDSDQNAHPGITIRYTGFPFFEFFNRTTWDASNTRLSDLTVVGLRIISGPGTGLTLLEFDRNIQFYQPYVLNAIDPVRMLIGTANIYESFDQGDSLANLGFTGAFIGNFLGASPMAYGGRLDGVPNPDVFYVGAGSTILHRVTVGDSITALLSYPGSGARGLVINPQNYRHVFVLDDKSHVWGSFDEGESWVNLTANLSTLSDEIRAIEVLSFGPEVRHVRLTAGGLGGVFQLRKLDQDDASWHRLGKGLPHGLVLDLHHNATDDVLLAGILGRGAWILNDVSGDDNTALAATEEETVD